MRKKTQNKGRIVKDTPRIQREHKTEKLEKRKAVLFSFDNCELPQKGGKLMRFLIETLKDFGSPENLKRRKPHPLNNSQSTKKWHERLGGAKLWSVDVGKRGNKEHGNTRLIYYRDKMGTVKVLSPCTTETH